MAKILLIEDEKEVSALVRDWLVDHDKYMLDLIENGTDGLLQLRVHQYDLVIIDWNLPGLSGVEICKQFRQSGGGCPILMLTGKSEISEKEEGFNSGADDYLTKPFDLRELSVRVRALLRRPQTLLEEQLNLGGLCLNRNDSTVVKTGSPIALTPREFELLEFFMRNAGIAFSPEAIMQRLWASDSEASPDGLRVHIKRLRDKIDNPGEPSLIKTVHRVGYKFEV